MAIVAELRSGSSALHLSQRARQFARLPSCKATNHSHSLIEGGDLLLRNLRVRPHETKGMNGLLFLLKKLSQSDYFAELSASTKAGVLRHRPSEVA